MSEEILIALKEIHARYCIPASEQNYTDKDYACMQYEKLVIHLQQKVEQLENIRKEAIEYINKNWGHWCSNHWKYATETINILNKGSDKE